MTLKEQFEQLLLHHGFERGRSINTKDWYAKGGVHEIRIMDKGFTHTRNRCGKFISENYANVSLKLLELVIFDNRLNNEGSKRQHAGFVIPIQIGVEPLRPTKRPAKRVAGFVGATI